MEHPLIFIYTLATSLAVRLYHVLLGPRLWNAEQEQEVFDENPDGTGLLVVLHGYKASRANLYRQIQKLRAASATQYRALFVPHVHYERDQTIVDANADILSAVWEFCRDYRGEPVLLVGISTGGRLAVHIENALRREPCAVHVVTVGSPLCGTSLAKMPGARWVVGRTLVQEFDPRSMLHDLIAEAVCHSDDNRTFYHFYSTTDHMVFPPYRCVTPTAPLKACAHALHRCAHHDMFEHPDVQRHIATFRFAPTDQ